VCVCVCVRAVYHMVIMLVTRARHQARRYLSLGVVCDNDSTIR
jgi:hypothetical protein